MPSRKSKRPKAAPLLMIDWDDATSENAEWKDTEHDELEMVVRCRSVGWLAGKNARQVTLVQTVTNDAGFTGEINIPRGCIVRMRRLR